MRRHNNILHELCISNENKNTKGFPHTIRIYLANRFSDIHSVNPHQNHCGIDIVSFFSFFSFFFCVLFLKDFPSFFFCFVQKPKQYPERHISAIWNNIFSSSVVKITWLMNIIFIYDVQQQKLLFYIPRHKLFLSVL